MDEFALLDALGQAALVTSGQVKPEELVLAAVARIERLDPLLNAVVTRRFEQAIAEACRAPRDTVFAGVPFLVKDFGEGEVAGLRHTEGSRALGAYVSPADSELVSRLRRSGLIICGKTNTPEFAVLPTTEPQRFGPTRNPWAPDRSAGGSSGGSAAAVAAGMVPAAHGSDSGGSLRIPASACGLFGLKPTRARTPLGPRLGDVLGGLQVAHALTRSVRDSAALLDVTCGAAVGDPYWAPEPSRPFLEAIRHAPTRLHIGLARPAPDRQVHPDCLAAAIETARLCQELGHRVEEVTLPVDPEEIADAYLTLWACGMDWMLLRWEGLLGHPIGEDDVEPLTWALAQLGRGYRGAQYLDALARLQRISRQVAEGTRHLDAVIGPVTTEPTPLLGSFTATREEPFAGLVRAADFIPFTPLANITGQPAMSVPLHQTSDGLPVGVHVVGRFGDEATLLRLAAQLERARPWVDRWPALVEPTTTGTAA
jgi:amidase